MVLQPRESLGLKSEMPVFSDDGAGWLVRRSIRVSHGL